MSFSFKAPKINAVFVDNSDKPHLEASGFREVGKTADECAIAAKLLSEISSYRLIATVQLTLSSMKVIKDETE